VFHSHLGDGGKTGEAVAGDTRAGVDILGGAGLDFLAGET
jgi:hypothetical protein